jgi:hypothetical protein
LFYYFLLCHFLSKCPVFYGKNGNVPFFKYHGNPRLALSEGPNRVGVFPLHLRLETDPVSEMFCFLVSRIPDDGQVLKPTNSECYTPSSEPFRIYMCLLGCLRSKCQCSRRLPTAAARVSTWDFVMDKSGAGAGFLRELRFPLSIYIPSCSPQSSSLSHPRLAQ